MYGTFVTTYICEDNLMFTKCKYILLLVSFIIDCSQLLNGVKNDMDTLATWVRQYRG